MTFRSRHPHTNGASSPPRLPQERREQVERALATISAKNGCQNDYQLSQVLGLNSAHFYNFRNKETFGRTLDTKLVELGYLEPLPEPELVYPCACGQVHTRKTCPNKSGAKRSPRISISKVDMERAAEAILKHIDPDDVGDLIDFLLEVDDND